MKKWTAILLLCIVALSCNTRDTAGNNPVPYVDFQSFFTGEVQRLTEENAILIKRSKVNDETSQDTLDSAAWTGELYPFLEIDIHEAAWNTDFRQVVDHSDINESSTVLVTTNPRQRYKKIRFKLDDQGQVSQLTVDIEDQSKLSSTNTKLSYTTGVGYTIFVTRDTKVLGSEDFQIVGQIISKNE